MNQMATEKILVSTDCSIYLCVCYSLKTMPILVYTQVHSAPPHKMKFVLPNPILLQIKNNSCFLYAKWFWKETHPLVSPLTQSSSCGFTYDSGLNLKPFHKGQVTPVLQQVLAFIEHPFLMSMHEPSFLITAHIPTLLALLCSHSCDATLPSAFLSVSFLCARWNAHTTLNETLASLRFMYFIPSTVLPVLNQNSPENCFRPQTMKKKNIEQIYFKWPPVY